MPATIDWWQYERQAWSSGREAVGGIDEAGRGPIAGPVVAACVVLPPMCDLPLAVDSKRLSPARREEAYASIRATARSIGIGQATSAEIDQLNILRATHLAMRRATEACTPGPDFVLVDGLAVVGLPLPHRAVVKGDSLSRSIAAASVIAKVTRDHAMRELHLRYPEYGFDRHVGYPTPDHLQALRRAGPCPEHRRTFGPVAAVGPQPCLDLDEPVSRPRCVQSGKIGQRVAEAHLLGLGWRIVDRRKRLPAGEIDIIAEDGAVVVFVEVKCRSGAGYGTGADAVDRAKRQRISSAAEQWIAISRRSDAVCRFDVVEVTIRPDGTCVPTVWRDAFRPGD